MLKFCHAAVLVATVWLVSQSAFSKETNTDYQLGRGYKIADTGIQLGGYASAHFNYFNETPDRSWGFETSDLSLFVSWSKGGRLRLFSELEVEDAFTVSEHHGLTTNNAHFSLERVYADYLINDTVAVRFGKFLTPIGQWNLLHVDPLLWTTTRPVATENLFSKRVTGMMVHGTVPLGEQSIDYMAYADDSAALDPAPQEDFGNALGLRLRYNVSDTLQLGFSYANFISQYRNNNTRNNLVGMDVAWTYQRLSVTSEVVYRHNPDTLNNANAWQGYIQGVGRLNGHLYGVGRYEFFDQPNQPRGQVGVLGLAYHPTPPLIWKLEYRLGTNNLPLAPDGLFASFAVMF